MKEFQKIAIGLLGLTHPEMFIPRPKPNVTAATKGADSSPSPSSTASPGSCGGPAVREGSPVREGRVTRLIRAFKFMLTAFAIGSRSVPLGDNRELHRELSARARLLCDSDNG
jgi:hypothetical protein